VSKLKVKAEGKAKPSWITLSVEKYGFKEGLMHKRLLSTMLE